MMMACDRWMALFCYCVVKWIVWYVIPCTYLMVDTEEMIYTNGIPAYTPMYLLV
jgi:hypothetical protein